jgi:hypothetical protein
MNSVEVNKHYVRVWLASKLHIADFDRGEKWTQSLSV